MNTESYILYIEKYFGWVLMFLRRLGKILTSFLLWAPFFFLLFSSPLYIYLLKHHAEILSKEILVDNYITFAYHILFKVDETSWLPIMYSQVLAMCFCIKFLLYIADLYKFR